MRCATVVLTILASESFQAHFTNQEGGWERDGPSLVTEGHRAVSEGSSPPAPAEARSSRRLLELQNGRLSSTGPYFPLDSYGRF